MERTCLPAALSHFIPHSRWWVHELLHGNPRHIKDQLGMEKHVSGSWSRKLFTLTNVSNTRHVDLEEQVAIFLYIIVTNLSNRKVAECFQRRWQYYLKVIIISLNSFNCHWIFYLFIRCFNLILNSVTSPASTTSISSNPPLPPS